MLNLRINILGVFRKPAGWIWFLYDFSTKQHFLYETTWFSTISLRNNMILYEISHWKVVSEKFLKYWPTSFSTEQHDSLRNGFAYMISINIT